MKKLLLSAMILFLPLAGFAQNTWEIQKDANNTAVNPDQKYLAGAVPVVDGKVVFETTIDAPGKTAGQIYDIVKKYLTKMTKEENQLEQSRIILDDSIKHEVCGHYQEWLVFKSTALVLDRTRFFYNLLVTCDNGKANVKMMRLYYYYDEERIPQTYKAEEWITDEYGLKKSKKKLSRVTGRFRKKTIDRKDYIFNQLASVLK